jgi:hypothetical protein
MLIRLELVRELHPHFPKDASELTIDHTTELAAAKWHLLGSNDYLLVTKVDSLPQLGDLYGGRIARENSKLSKKPTPNSKNKSDRTAKPRAVGVQEWILCQPFKEHQENLNEAYNTLTCESSGPVLMMAASFSSAYFDQLDYKQIVAATEKLMGDVQEVANSYKEIKKSHVLTSLGGMDLAIVIDVGNQGLNKSFELLNRLRELRHKVGGEFFHHYFSQVNAFFCFRTKEDLSSIQNADDLAIISRIKTVCGHQEEFLGKPNPPEEGIYVTMGAYSLTKVFPSISALSSFEHLAMTPNQHLEACRKGFDGSRTEIAIPTNKLNSSTSKEVGKHLKITLHKDLENFGQLIDDVVELLPNRLGYVSGREMSKALLTVKKALTRNERIGALRDLFPFVSQLCYCILHEQWVAIDRVDLNTRQAIISSASQLTIHLWRAIRNRIESRVESLDPSFPGTLDSGTSKLMNGYSVAAWLCWGIFNAVDSNSFCASDSFAACVAAGYSGRIQTQEAFADLRKEIENPSLHTIVKNITPLGSGKEKSWHSRLLLLDISGHVIFRPEVAFLHCVHEMAEFSDWWSLKHTISLRQVVNKFQFRFFLRGLFDDFRKDVATSISLNEFKERIITLILVNRKNAPVTTQNAMESFNQVFIRAEDPTWIGFTFFRELAELDPADQTFLRHVGQDIDSGFVRTVSNAAKKVLYSELTSEGTSVKGFNLFQKRDLFREMIADYSMFFVLHKYRSIESGSSGGVDIQEVDYNYGCIVDQISSWMPAASQEESPPSSQEEIQDQFVRFNDVFCRWILQRIVVKMIPSVTVSSWGIDGGIPKNEIKDFKEEWDILTNECVDTIAYYFCLFERGKPIGRDGLIAVKEHILKVFRELEQAGIIGTRPGSLCCQLAMLAKIDNSNLISENFLRNDPAKFIFGQFESVWRNSVSHCASIVSSLDISAGNPEQIIEIASRKELSGENNLETQRLAFAWTVWAKSQKLCFEHCFVVG